MTALSFVWVHPYSQNSGCDPYHSSVKHMSNFIQIVNGTAVIPSDNTCLLGYK